MSKLDFSKFKDKIHPTWHSILQPLIEGPELWDVYKHLTERKQKGVTITPEGYNIWRAFKETRWDNLYAIIVGFCPYHTKKNGILVADGLCMSCSKTEVLQPSLEKYYEAIEAEMYDGFKVDMEKDADLSFLANQGVLLLNSALTTEVNEVGKHQDLWFPFMKRLFLEVLSIARVPMLFMGKDAEELIPYAGDGYIVRIEHPASAARKNRAWETKGAFKKFQELVKANNNYNIQWDNTPPF